MGEPEPDEDANEQRREAEQVVDGEGAVDGSERGLEASLVKEAERLLDADDSTGVRDRLVRARDREAADDEVEAVDGTPEREFERGEPDEVERRERSPTSGGGGGGGRLRRHVDHSGLARLRRRRLLDGSTPPLPVVRRLDRDVRQEPVEPTWDVPRLLAHQRQERGDERHPDDQGVGEVATARRSPNSFEIRSAVRMNAAKTVPMMMAAATTTRPIAAIPCSTASRVGRPWTCSSRIRLMIKTM